jgi:transposase-like protein
MSRSTEPARRARVMGRYSPELARGICARIAKGESLAAICREHGMPPRSTVEAWTSSRSEFGAAFAKARAQAGGPAKGGRPSRYRPKVGAELCRRIGEGEALHVICRDPAMPSQSGFYLWLHRYPEFAEMYAVAREIQAFRLFDEVREIAEAATPETLQIAKLRIAAIQWQAARLGPKGPGVAARDAVEDDGPQPFAIEVVNFLPPGGEA